MSRGVCQVILNSNLVSIIERTKIFPEGGHIYYVENSMRGTLPADTPVSMNFWGFHANIFDFTEKLFHAFLQENEADPKAEFFIPIIGDAFIKGDGEIKVIPTDAQWLGVTYKEDAPVVKESLQKLIEDGAYPQRLC